MERVGWTFSVHSRSLSKVSCWRLRSAAPYGEYSNRNYEHTDRHTHTHTHTPTTHTRSLSLTLTRTHRDPVSCCVSYVSFFDMQFETEKNPKTLYDFTCF